MSGAQVPDPRAEGAGVPAVPAGEPARVVEAAASAAAAHGVAATDEALPEQAADGAAPARGFPGFPAGDPRQLPLSQRPRGLDAPPPPGGTDPEMRQTLSRERPYVRLLVGMVAVIVGGSLLLTFLALLSAAILR